MGASAGIDAAGGGGCWAHAATINPTDSTATQFFMVFSYVLSRIPGPPGRTSPASRNTTPVTIHGFRSSFRDGCAKNGVSRDLAEAALAHAIKDKTEAAYNRTSMVEKRREVMERWTTFAYAIVNFST
jgi:hypothetical protein